jgi:PadR family transcriptional regulator, regulatory protein PadR
LDDEEGERAQEMLLGTLDMLILRTLLGGAAHGHTIARMIEQTSDGVFEVEQGSLYPALHRLEDRRWVAAYWGTSENNRKGEILQIDRSGAESIKRGTEPFGGSWSRRLGE